MSATTNLSKHVTMVTISLLLALGIFAALPAYAQTSEVAEVVATTTQEAIEDNATTTEETELVPVEEVVTGEVTDVPPPIETPNAVLNARTQERITNLAANISNRFDAVIARMQNISGRLNSRLDKQAGEGGDVTAARASLQSVNASLLKASQSIGNIDEQVLQLVGSTNPLPQWQVVRGTYLETKDTILTAHRELRSTIAILKNPAPLPVATSTEPAQ